LSDAVPAAGSAFITARKTLFQDVTIKIGDQVLRNAEDVQGVECRLSSDLSKIEQHSTGGSGKKNDADSRTGRMKKQGT
jgi:hypothetical protein